ncbi:helix-turn-helix domain-containing protein [Compostibacter hankyongensis]|uniref:HTH cro/C1-type domain-containing protein n=1 Tax=Compostibacter hankyongensis TaxID=1007089 RepID=A0ABP8FVM3_9BACT
MNWKVLKTESAYKKAAKRAMAIFEVGDGTPEADELALLLVLIKDYEDKHIRIPEVNPLEVIKLKMEERGMKAKDLEPIIGSKGHVSSILSGRREITLKMAQRLKDFFQLPADIFFSDTLDNFTQQNAGAL